MRRIFLITAIFIVSLSYGQTVHTVCKTFSLSDVRLLKSRFYDNMQRDSSWMMTIPVNSLLHSFRTNAGIYSGNEGGYFQTKKLAGWESLDCELRGHITGHLLSALAVLYANTASKAVKIKADSIIDGLRDVQNRLGADGYLSAFPEECINRNIRGERVWAPFYTLHKLLQGLIDQYTLCGNDTALAIARKMGNWAYNKLKPLNETTRQLMIKNEFGGFNEAMLNLYAITRDDRYQWVARFFYNDINIDPLKSEKDELGTKHANTFIPKVLGEARNYEITGDVKSRNAAEFFYKLITTDHIFATGELSDKEHLFDPMQQSRHLTGYDGENCCTYNMLKLTRHLFSWNGNEKEVEYYERALYNHILGQQDTITSMVSYFTPLLAGAYRLYSTRDSSYWCCVGSGFESHVNYPSFIYAHSDDGLYVNLFIPSVLKWRGMIIRQETRFPEENKTRLSFSGVSGSMSLYMRYPLWATYIKLTVNGKELKIKSSQGSYVEIRRFWKDGDEVTAEYGMSLHEEATRDDDSQCALLYGPIVLAGRLSGVDNPFSNPKKYNDYYTFDFHVPSDVSEKSCYGSLKDFKHTSGTHFLSPSGIDVLPFYDMHHCRYVVYWKKSKNK